MREEELEEDSWTLVLKETTDPEVRLRLLAFRVSVITREKETLERRVARLETLMMAGKGIFWAAPFLMMIVSFFWYNWGWFSRPWSKPQ